MWEGRRICLICREPKPGASYPNDILICRECDLSHHRADLNDLTPEVFVAGSGWRLAKTMLDCPHQYTVRDLASPDAHRTTAMGHAEFEWFARLLASQGEPGQWGSRTYRYYELGGWEYWTMGFAPEVTTIINRRAASAEAEVLLERQVVEARRSIKSTAADQRQPVRHSQHH
ncbi:MAG: hypothetical protein IPK93_02710 [Solirubrobacterales bacterium]|nr:hypothetical protein [Solirubrobacterales bacterium]